MLYQEYINEALRSVTNIYGPDAMGYKLEEFKKFFEDSTISSSMNGSRVYFTSGGDIPTHNIKQALIGSGINKEGKLPIGRCFLTNELEDDNIQDIIEETINKKMDHLVGTMQGKDGVNDYISKNPKSDPNAYQMVDMFTTYHNLVASQNKPPEDIKTDLDNMFDKRKQNFIENGIGLDSAAYRVCEFCYQPENLDDYPLPAVTIEAMKKIASLDLYSRQQVRNGEQLFDNVSEVETVKNYFNASQTLKHGFLDKFENDLNNIYNMARENREKSNENQRN